MKLKDSELKNILAEVEQEFQTMLKTEQADLKKAAGSKDDPSEEGSSSSGGDASAPAPEASASPEASAPTEGSAPPAAADASASATPDPAASAAPEMSASPDGSAPVDPAAQAAPADPEALKAEYSKLDPESLKAHYMAAKAALFEQMGAAGDGSADPAAAGAPVPPPEASASAPAAMPPPAMKAEVPASIKNIPATADTDNVGKTGGKGGLEDVKMSKSEEVQDLQKQVELLTKAIELSLGTPVRKAITSVNELPKEEQKPAETKLTVQEKIRKAMGSGKLTKNQKDSLFSYALGNTEFDTIKDLLEVK